MLGPSMDVKGYSDLVVLILQKCVLFSFPCPFGESLPSPTVEVAAPLLVQSSTNQDNNASRWNSPHLPSLKKKKNMQIICLWTYSQLFLVKDQGTWTEFRSRSCGRWKWIKVLIKTLSSSLYARRAEPDWKQAAAGVHDFVTNSTELRELPLKQHLFWSNENFARKSLEWAAKRSIKHEIIVHKTSQTASGTFHEEKREKFLYLWLEKNPMFPFSVWGLQVK